MTEIYGSNDQKKIPLMSGHRFANRNENGEAVWEKTNPISLCIDPTKFGTDDDLAPLYNGDMPISDSDEYGMRGEKIFTLKTVYTKIIRRNKHDY
jgi:hypothetical protein